MGDLKARLKPLFRRSSTLSSNKSSASDSSNTTASPLGEGRSWSKSSLRLSKNRKSSLPIPVFEDTEPLPHLPPTTPLEIFTRGEAQHPPATSPPASPSKVPQRAGTQYKPATLPPKTPSLNKNIPRLAVEAPTPTPKSHAEEGIEGQELPTEDLSHLAESDACIGSGSPPSKLKHRKQSIVDNSQPHIVAELLQSGGSGLGPTDSESLPILRPASTAMQRKKIWVKRPGSSATQVMINEEDLVDDVRDMILRKYANSLGRSFDSPDVTLRIIFRHPSGRHSQTERTLGPEEAVSKILDLYFPGGQAVEEALVIDVPQKRTPKHSPHLAMPYYLADDGRPRENGNDYFPPMPPPGQRSPHLPTNVSVASASGNPHPPPHSIGVLTTGHIPSLPSPGGRIARHSHNRPKYGRQHTSSPTVLQGVVNGQQNHGEIINGVNGRSIR